MLHDGVSGGHESQEETARADEEPRHLAVTRWKHIWKVR